MKARRRAGVICGGCGQFCYELSNGKLSEHSNGSYAIGGIRRQRCSYSGGTWADAREKITPIKRRRLDREAEEQGR